MKRHYVVCEEQDIQWFDQGLTGANIKELEDLAKTCSCSVQLPESYFAIVFMQNHDFAVKEFFGDLLKLFPEGLAVFVYRDKPLLGDGCAWEIKNNRLLLYGEEVITLNIEEDEYWDDPECDWIGVVLDHKKLLGSLPKLISVGLSIFSFFVSRNDFHRVRCVLRHVHRLSKLNFFDDLNMFAIIHCIDPVIIRGHDGDWIEVWIRSQNPLRTKFLEVFPLEEQENKGSSA